MKDLHIAKLFWALSLATSIEAGPPTPPRGPAGPAGPPGPPGPRGPADKCHVLPGDAAWPNDQAWSALNQTVSGKLIKTVPIGSPCHDPTYDETACTELKAQWTNPLTQ